MNPNNKHPQKTQSISSLSLSPWPMVVVKPTTPAGQFVARRIASPGAGRRHRRPRRPRSGRHADEQPRQPYPHESRLEGSRAQARRPPRPIASHAKTVHETACWRAMLMRKSSSDRSTPPIEVAAALSVNILTVRPRVSRAAPQRRDRAHRRSGRMNKSGMRAICWRAKAPNILSAAQ